MFSVKFLKIVKKIKEIVVVFGKFWANSFEKYSK